MLVYGKYKCFIMHMLYVCVLCEFCVSAHCCILHDLQFVNTGQGCKRRPYGRGDHMEEAYSRPGLMAAL